MGTTSNITYGSDSEGKIVYYNINYEYKKEIKTVNISSSIGLDTYKLIVGDSIKLIVSDINPNIAAPVNGSAFYTKFLNVLLFLFMNYISIIFIIRIIKEIKNKITINH
ncbi:MAG: hypothetical protein R2801_10360 [Chitinophagales bacterium]